GRGGWGEAAGLGGGGDLAPAEGQTQLRVPAGRVPGLLARKGPGIGAVWQEAGSQPLEALTHRLGVAFVEKGAVAVERKVRPAAPRRTPGLRWLAGGGRSPFPADAPAA